MDDSNSEHATRHGVTVDEITQVLLNDPRVHCIRKARSGDLFVLGATDGGQGIVVDVAWDTDRRVVRPITAWEQP
ncbi:MAG: hypothetical protein ACR2JU_13725 [Nocardioidaceae bacterium]